MPLLRANRTVLVIVDMVNDSVYGHWPVWNPQQLVANVAAVRDVCHRHDTPVIQLTHVHRVDGVDEHLGVPPAETRLPAACADGTWGAQVVGELQPLRGDVVVRKNRWHGFFGTDLLTVLRGLGTQQTLWVGGFTDCCVSLSVFEAYAHDYPVGVVADATACDNEFTHKAAMLTMANWIADFSVFTTASAVQWLRGEETSPWFSGGFNRVPFACEADVHAGFDELLQGSGGQTAGQFARRP